MMTLKSYANSQKAIGEISKKGFGLLLGIIICTFFKTNFV